jgi:PKD repeat protein
VPISIKYGQNNDSLNINKMKNGSIYIIIGIVSLNVSCHLARIEQFVKAEFTVRQNACESPCDPGFVNISEYATDFIWNFGDSTQSIAEKDPVHVFQKPGVFKVVLVAIGDGQRDTFEKIVNIIAPGQTYADFSILNDSCIAPCTTVFVNKSMNFTDSEWDFGDSTPKSHEKNPLHTYEKPGIYKCMLVVSKNSMKDSLAKTVTVFESNPIACFSSNIDSCYAPCLVSFDNCSTGSNSYIWDFGDGSPLSIEKTPKKYYNVAGIYTVKLVAINSVISKSDTFYHEIKIKPHTYKTSLTASFFDSYKVWGFNIVDTNFVMIIENKTTLPWNHRLIQFSSSNIDENTNYSIVAENNSPYSFSGCRLGLTNSFYGTIIDPVYGGEGYWEISNNQINMNFLGTHLVQIVQGQDGSYGVISNTVHGPTIYYFNILNNPNQAASYTFPYPSTTWSNFESEIGTFDNNYYFIYNNGVKSFAKIDSSGPHLLNSNIDPAVGGGAFSLLSHNKIIFSSNNKLYVFDINGSPVWSNLFDFYIIDLKISSDGQYIACGYKNGDIVLAKINIQSGVLIWQKEFDFNNQDDNCTAITSLKDGYVIVGNTNNRIFIIRTNLEGNIE